MIKWKELIKYHLNAPKTSIFIRHPNIQTDYDIHKKTITSLKQHIMKKELHNKLKWNIVDNNFPYNLDDGIKHKLLWIHPDVILSDNKIKTIIDRYITLNNYNQYIYFQNHENNRSVPEIKHYHIFINTD